MSMRMRMRMCMCIGMGITSEPTRLKSVPPSYRSAARAAFVSASDAPRAVRRVATREKDQSV